MPHRDRQGCSDTWRNGVSAIESKNGSTRDERVRLKRGDTARLRVVSMAPGGEAVSRDLGIPVFIERGAPGDLAEVEIFDVRKDFARARVLQVLEPSEQRAEPPCKLFKVCGGCQWQHLSYEAQLLNKQDIVKQAVQRIGKLDADLVKPVIPASHPLHYRNKVQFPVRNPANSDRILAGYFKPNSHDLVNVKHCPIQPEPLDAIIETAKELLEKHRIRAYDEKSQTGLLRHITARHSFDKGEVLVTFVLNMSAGDARQAFLDSAEELMGRHSEVIGVSANLNCQSGNRIYGDETICLAGKPYLEEILKTSRTDMPVRLQEGLTFRLSPTSFFQINTAQAIRLLEEVHDSVYEDQPNKPLIVDAYSGVGAITLWLAPLARQVVAIEEHEQAVLDGQLNSDLNGINNTSFRLGTVEEIAPALLSEGLEPDVVVVDPPRKGVDAAVLKSLRQLAPRTIVYVSCNPATLARDLRILGELGQGTAARDGRVYGYKTKQIQPVDLFPQTYHIESVARLERFD